MSSTKQIEPADLVDENNQAKPLESIPERDEVDAPTPRLLLVDGENGAACTAEGCAVTFGKDK